MATRKSVTYRPAQQHLFGPNKTECDTHGKQLRKYCPNHLMPCCDECISQSHSKCIGITSLASVVEKTNIEKSKESVGKDINSILQFLDKMVNNKSENIQRGEKQYQNIKASISEIKMEINKNLDNLEKKLCKEADTIWGQEKSKLTDFIKEIEEQKKGLKEMQDDLRTVQEHTSKLQSFLGVHQIEQQVHQCQLYIDEQNETVIEVEIKLIKNDEIEQILSKVQSLTSLGEVKADETEIRLRKETGAGKEAQIDSQLNINNMKMNIEKIIHTNLELIRCLNDMICLTDGRIIVVEWNGTVDLISSDGNFRKQLSIYGAYCITQIKHDTIATTHPSKKYIKMFDMENESTTKSITVDKYCYGLFFSNDTLVVGLSSNEIRIVDLEGIPQKSIEVRSQSPLRQITYCNNTVIFCDSRGKSVSCIDRSGKQIWQYQLDLEKPKGLCTDTYGNIIVADYESDRIILISKDGQDSKVLFSEADALKGIRGLCFNVSSGFIFNILPTGVDFIKVNLSYK